MKWQQRVLNLTFLINFLVTAYTCIAFDVSCIPFNANWDTVPNSKYFSKDVLVITNQVNVGKIYLSPSHWDSALLLKSYSSCVRMRHRRGFDTPNSTMGRTDEGENQKAAELSLRSWSDHCCAEHCSGGHNHQEDTH